MFRRLNAFEAILIRSRSLGARSQALISVTVGSVFTSFGYNDNGNLRQEYALPTIAATTYHVDPEGRMVSVLLPDKTQWTHAYSADGLMRSYSGPGSALTTLVWDGADILQERS